MDFFEAAKERYSYRGKFTNQPLPKEDLLKILQAGCEAPTGLNKQTCSFVAITSPEMRAKVAQLFDGEHVATAQALVLVLSRKEEWDMGIDFEYEDFSAATQNLLLAITALGYASVWIEGYVYKEGREEALRKLLNIPAEYTPRALLPIGVPETPGAPKEKKPLEERVHFDTF